MHSATRKGNGIESGLSVLPNRSRRCRGRAQGLSGLRHAAPYGLLRGKRGMYSFRLCAGTGRRGKSDGHRYGHGRQHSHAAGNSTHAAPRRFAWYWIYDVPCSECGGPERQAASCFEFRRERCPPSSAARGNRSRPPAASGTGALCAKLCPGPARKLLPATAAEDSCSFCAAGYFPGRSRRTQFLCGLHKKGRDSTLPDFADVLLRSSHQLAVGYYRDLCDKQGRGRQSVCVRLFADGGLRNELFH